MLRETFDRLEERVLEICKIGVRIEQFPGAVIAARTSMSAMIQEGSYDPELAHEGRIQSAIKLCESRIMPQIDSFELQVLGSNCLIDMVRKEHRRLLRSPRAQEAATALNKWQELREKQVPRPTLSEMKSAYYRAKSLIDEAARFDLIFKGEAVAEEDPRPMGKKRRKAKRSFRGFGEIQIQA
jgi:hypothetical protein